MYRERYIWTVWGAYQGALECIPCGQEETTYIISQKSSLLALT